MLNKNQKGAITRASNSLRAIRDEVQAAHPMSNVYWRWYAKERKLKLEADGELIYGGVVKL